MKRIGITGPTGAGKTTALGALEALGVCVIDADEVYHRLLEESGPLQAALTDRFGASILDERGKLDRKRLGDVVFDDPAALADLNGIAHRFILAEIARLERQAEQAGCPASAVDAIALIECGLAARCDAVVGVLAPKELRIRRIIAREGLSEAYARSRAEAQPPDSFYRARCTHILENREDDTPDAFAARARTLLEPLLSPDPRLPGGDPSDR